MKAKFILIGFAVVTLTALLPSCQKKTFLLVFNNRNEDIAMISYDETTGHGAGQKIKSGASGEVVWPSSMAIQCGSNAWEYATFPASVPLKYLDTRHGLKNFLKIQLEQDGLLDVLTPNANNVIVSNSLVQPEGFPLKPSATK